jgi:hypothetical protein
MKTIVAIDPGKEGGIAYQLANDPAVVALAMPATEGDILALLSLIMTNSNRKEAQPVAFLEQVGGFIKGRPAPGSAMFNFGRNFGFLLGCLQTLGFRIELVRPQDWQKALALGKSDGNKTAWKNKLKQRAQQLYPNLQVTLNTADALLILEHATLRAAGP